MSKRSYLLGLGLAPVVVFGGLVLAVSCTSPNPAADGGSDGGGGSGPCSDGTIQLLECEPDDAGAVEDPFTDEACQGLDTAETRSGVMHNDMQAPAIDAPTEGQAVPGAAPFHFTWHPTGLSRRAPVLRAPRAYTWRDELIRWSSLIPAAEAHCAPYGGVAFAVVFKNAAGQVVLRAETSHRDYTPTADAWTRLRAVSGTISMTVEAARFSNNAVTEGPFDQTTPRHFTITP